MQYITDEHKNITHVLVPIDKWNMLQEKLGELEFHNPYQSVIDYLGDMVKKAEKDYGDIFPPQKLSQKYTGTAHHVNLPIYRLLIDILKGDEHIAKIVEDIKNPKVSNLGLHGSITSFVLPSHKIDAKTIAVFYILRNKEFYGALCNSKDTIWPGDQKIFQQYGFDIEKFKSEVDPGLLTVLYTQHKSEFIRESSPIIAKYFSLTPIKERIRREPELLRLFFFDIFEAHDELIGKEPLFGEIFRKYPLVDKLAKEFYPSNTLSGATSRVYKAAKEARTIINTDWQKYVSVN